MLAVVDDVLDVLRRMSAKRAIAVVRGCELGKLVTEPKGSGVERYKDWFGRSFQGVEQSRCCVYVNWCSCCELLSGIYGCLEACSCADGFHDLCVILVRRVEKVNWLVVVGHNCECVHVYRCRAIVK